MVDFFKNKKLTRFINLTVAFFLCIFLCGCSTLSYVGDDYNSDNVQTVKTQEDFVFNTFKKQVNPDVALKVGISKTSIPEILALYVQIDNLSYDTAYNFRVEDLRVYNPKKEIQFITTNNYLSIYQNQEANAMAAMSTLSSTFSNMTGMMTNYNDMNQTIMQNTNQASTQNAFANMEALGNKILTHSVKVGSTVSPRKSQYYYFFFEDLETYPIYIKYKDLEYSFQL